MPVQQRTTVATCQAVLVVQAVWWQEVGRQVAATLADQAALLHRVALQGSS
jgi:hypothetical protein